ncbi:hypothetical protein [Streptomyces daliensis]
MGGLLTELGKKLAERWLSLLVLPGALYLAALGVARELGHERWYAVGGLPGRLARHADHLTSPAAPAAATALFLVAFLLASATCGVAAQALGSVLERCWLAPDWSGWPSVARRPVRALTRRRRARYERRRADLARVTAEARVATAAGVPLADEDDVAVARQRLRRVSPGRPGRPTWAGDRMRAVEAALRESLGLELGVVWPHLWLYVPESTRVEVTAARGAMVRAAALAGWGLLYGVVGALWWPGLLVAAGVVGTGWRRFRAATDEYALLTGAAVRLHAHELARALAIGHAGPLTKEAGTALTAYLISGQAPAASLRLPAEGEPPGGSR